MRSTKSTEETGSELAIRPPSTDTLDARKTLVVQCGNVTFSAHFSAVQRAQIQENVLESGKIQGLRFSAVTLRY